MTLLPEKYRYIVVEGPVGAGKTSLARMLAERSGSAALLEDPDANPFLPGFYQDRARYALPTQLFFLFQRLNQVRAVSQADLFRRAPRPGVRAPDFGRVSAGDRRDLCAFFLPLRRGAGVDRELGISQFC